MTNRWVSLPHPTQPGQVGGHEGVGKIVKMGSGTESSAVKIGDRVGIKWLSGICGSCAPCLSGHDGQCFSQKVSGYYTPGTFQQYVLGPVCCAIKNSVLTSFSLLIWLRQTMSLLCRRAWIVLLRRRCCVPVSRCIVRCESRERRVAIGLPCLELVEG